MGIESTREWQQSINMRPACNRVLMDVFGIKNGDIIRYESSDQPHILDVEFAIDLKVLLPCGGQLSGQEKALSNRFYHFRTFTIEFYQNRFNCEPGEFFKIASQFYLSGYSDKTGVEFLEWHIIKMFDFLCWLKQFNPISLSRRCKPASGSKANFLPVPYDKLPKSLIFASGSGIGTTKIYSNIKDITCSKK